MIWFLNLCLKTFNSFFQAKCAWRRIKSSLFFPWIASPVLSQPLLFKVLQIWGIVNSDMLVVQNYFSDIVLMEFQTETAYWQVNNWYFADSSSQDTW